MRKLRIDGLRIVGGRRGARVATSSKAERHLTHGVTHLLRYVLQKQRCTCLNLGRQLVRRVVRGMHGRII